MKIYVKIKLLKLIKCLSKNVLRNCQVTIFFSEKRSLFNNEGDTIKKINPVVRETLSLK